MHALSGHHNNINMVIPCIVCQLPAYLVELILYPSVPFFSKDAHFSCAVSLIASHGKRRES